MSEGVSQSIAVARKGYLHSTAPNREVGRGCSRGLVQATRSTEQTDRAPTRVHP